MKTYTREIAWSETVAYPTLALLLPPRWIGTWKVTGSDDAKCFVLAHRSMQTKVNTTNKQKVYQGEQFPCIISYNNIPTCSASTLTMGMAFPHFPPPDDHWFLFKASVDSWNDLIPVFKTPGLCWIVPLLFFLWQCHYYHYILSNFWWFKNQTCFKSMLCSNLVWCMRCIVCY